ncbi:MAG: acetyltransferase [Planctomycetales bacterium]|jgi:sugar O-acyltransferase (sialic acid O-acetyltransferase NeuD family)
MVLFGVRSPLIVDYEETCKRLGIPISLAVSVNGTPRLLSDCPLVDIAEFDAAGAVDPFVSCAFAPSRRAELMRLAVELGCVVAPALVDPNAVLASSVRIGDGTFINAGVVIGAASIIGSGVLINRSASVGHHAALGDFVSLGPGATLAGNVHVEAGTMIGAGAIVLPNVRIGTNAIVAAGSLVRRDVAANTFVAGNPAVERTFDASKSSLHVEDGE